MIVTKELPLEIGKIYTRPFGYNTPMRQGWCDEFTFYVLREATKKEYIKYCKEEGCTDLTNLIINEFFYEISTD